MLGAIIGDVWSKLDEPIKNIIIEFKNAYEK